MIYEEVGKLLKEKRKKLNISLDEISVKVKIRKKYLIAIENSNLSELPGETYAHGYIKLYADFLGIRDTINNMISNERRINVNGVAKYKKAKYLMDDNKTLIYLFSVLLVLFISLTLYTNSLNLKKNTVIDYLKKEEIIYK